MANTLKFGNGEWYGKEDTILAYNDENKNYKPLPFSFERGSTATRINKEGLIETVGSGEPRIDYKDDSKGALLLEPSRTNLVTYSEDFSQWTNQSSGTGSAPIITLNNIISPDGTQNADKIVFNKGTGVSTSDLSIISSNSFTSQTNTVSFYIKADSPQKIVVRNSTNWQLIDVTTEWQRISKTDNGGGVQIGLRDGYGISGVPDTATIYLWGAQAEASSYATSYIPTQGTAQTRLADKCTGSGNSEVFNDSEGVLMAEISALADDGTARAITIRKDGGDFVKLLYSPSSNRIDFVTFSSTLLSCNITKVLSDTTDNNKIAIKYKQNDFALWVNGIKVGQDLIGNAPLGLNQLSFTDEGGVGSPFYGKVKQLKYYDTALTDQKLQVLIN